MGHSQVVSTPRKLPKNREPPQIDIPAKKPKKDTHVQEASSNLETVEVKETPCAKQYISHDHAYDLSECPGCVAKNIEIKKLKAQVFKMSKEIKSLKTKIKEKEEQPFGYSDVRNDESIKFYTGIPSMEAFETILSVLKPHLSKIHYWNGPRVLSHPLKQKLGKQKLGRRRRLSVANELLLTLMKIRLGLLNEDLAQRFGISKQHVSNIFTTWVKILSRVLGDLVFNPPKEVVRENLPPSFRNPTFNSVRHIIDCTEVFLETPNNLQVRTDTWSDYKHHNTAKFLISITPSGMISYVSQGWGGRTSDKYITENSGFLDLVEPYDKILADRGFPIAEDLLLLNAELLIPPGRRGVSQFSKKEVEKTKQIANRRIYVEQAIRRMKFFRLLKNELPITLLQHLDDIVRIVAGLCNLYPALPRY
jgi:hypothetical protein